MVKENFLNYFGKLLKIDLDIFTKHNIKGNDIINALSNFVLRKFKVVQMIF